MNILKTGLSAITAGATLYGIGRKLARNRIEKNIQKTIIEASELARERVRSGASSYLNEAWSEFVVTNLIKVIFILALWALAVSTTVPKATILIIASVFLGLSLTFDIYRRRFLISSAVRLIRQFGFKPRTIVKHLVAERVFVEVMLEAKEKTASLAENSLISLGGHKRNEIETKIADAVSKAAGETAWEDVRPFLRTAAIRFTVLAIVYSALVALMLRQISTS